MPDTPATPIPATAGHPTPVVMLSVKELAVALRCSSATVKTLIRKGTIPSVKIGGMRRIRLTAFEAYLDSLEDSETAAQHAA